MSDLSSASLADLHEALGRAVCGPDGMVRPNYQGAHVWDAEDERLRGLHIDAQVSIPNLPPVENTPFIQTLREDWAETDRLMDAAWARYKQHRNGSRYKAECHAITNRAPVEHIRSQGVRQWLGGGR